MFFLYETVSETITEVNKKIDESVQISYKKWLFKEKTTIRFNSVDVIKRTWNKIELISSFSSKIKSPQFANGYAKNWTTKQ
jgi:hypothetical protein